MKEIKLYVLWDDVDRFKLDRAYLDEESAKIALDEHYNSHWIVTGRAKIQEIRAVSYVSSSENG